VILVIVLHVNMSRIQRLKTDIPIGIMQPRQQQLVQSVHTAAASVLPSFVSASTLLVLLNTPSSINVIVEHDGILRQKDWSFSNSVQWQAFNSLWFDVLLKANITNITGYTQQHIYAYHKKRSRYLIHPISTAINSNHTQNLSFIVN